MSTLTIRYVFIDCFSWPTSVCQVYCKCISICRLSVCVSLPLCLHCLLFLTERIDILRTQARLPERQSPIMLANHTIVTLTSFRRRYVLYNDRLGLTNRPS